MAGSAQHCVANLSGPVCSWTRVSSLVRLDLEGRLKRAVRAGLHGCRSHTLAGSKSRVYTLALIPSFTTHHDGNLDEEQEVTGSFYKHAFLPAGIQSHLQIYSRTGRVGTTKITPEV